MKLVSLDNEGRGRKLTALLAALLLITPFAAERLAAGCLPGLPDAELSFAIVAEEFGSSNRAVMVAAK